MSDKNKPAERTEVRNTMIGCIVAILAFHLAWGLQVFKHKVFFYIVDVPLLALFAFMAMAAIRNSDDPGRDWTRYVALAVAAALCIWAGAWNSEAITWAEQFPIKK